MESKKLVVLTTCGSAEEAELVARHLVEKRVAACVNIVPGARSIYWWQGQLEEAPEFLLIAKTRADRMTAFEAELKSVHSYATPELIALPVEQGSADYLSWLDHELDMIDRS